MAQPYRIKACDLRPGMKIVDDLTGIAGKLLHVHDDDWEEGVVDFDDLYLVLVLEGGNVLRPHPKARMIVLHDGIPDGFE